MDNVGETECQIFPCHQTNKETFEDRISSNSVITSETYLRRMFLRTITQVTINEGGFGTHSDTNMETWLLRAVFVLSSLILSKTQDLKSGLSCLRSSLSDGQTLLTFLRKDAASARFLLYLTRWTDDTRLVACEIHSHPSITEGYRAFCGRNKTWGQEIQSRVNISALLHPDAPCALTPLRAPDGSERGARTKRSWIFPGTLWCGSGSRAAGYEQLGMFERADRCCREHDHCSHIIPGFRVNYGVFNPNFFTVSHCECDQRFRQCLLGMNDSISGMMGYSFFNILKVPCFELKQLKRCTQMYWWGMCKVAKLAPYAVFRSPLPYNSSDVSGNYVPTDSKNLTSSEEQHLSNTQRKPSKSKHRCGLRDLPRGDTFHRRTKGRGCKKHQKLSKPEPSLVHTTPNTQTMTQTLMLEKKIVGKKKSIRKGFAGLVQKSNVSLKVSSNPDNQTSSTTTSSAPPLTQKLMTAAKERNNCARGKKKFQKQRGCCRSSKSVKNDTSPLRCTSCLQKETTSHLTTGERLGKANRSPVSRMKNTGMHIKKATATHNRNTSETRSTQITAKQKTKASVLEDGKQQNGLGSYRSSNNTNQQLSGNTINIQAKNSSVHNNELQDLTDNQLQCQSFKHLDDCKFKIPPLGKKYNLQNTESKTVYHCDCTSRLAVQIKNFQKTSIAPSLLEDFVSQQCFTLPKEKKCHRNKRCSDGFTKASDLHRALKKLKEKDTTEMGFLVSDRRKRIPVRLYKHCLKLQMKADIMSKLNE